MRIESIGGNRGRLLAATLVVLLTLGGLLPAAHAARAPKGDRDPEAAGDLYAARRLLKTGQDLLLAGETERGVEVLKKVIDQYPESDVRYEAYLALGKHLIEISKQQQAIGYLNFLRELEEGDQPLTGDQQDILLEGLFLMGKAYFQMRQYSSAFPVLRKITNNFPNTDWANEAYYYIGMSHFAQENWNMAIEALSKVGTYIDPDSSTVEYVEAGQRFYVKVRDGDLPVRHRLGEKVEVTIATGKGDAETIECIPLGGDSDVFIGSLPTAIGLVQKNSGSLEVIGGDSISVRYADANTQDGQAAVDRAREVKVVSTASLTFTRGDLETIADGAYLGQPVFISLRDIDLDKTEAADTVRLRIVSRYQAEEETVAAAGDSFDLSSFLRESSGEAEYRERDALEIVLAEAGEAPVHSGVFTGRVEVVGVTDDSPADANDKLLSCQVGDTLTVTYLDELHINGDAPREVASSIKVLSEIESAPRATQYVVSDPVIRAKKNLVEASAYLELGRIFKSMGLRNGARERCDAGLELVNSIIRSDDGVPRTYHEQAFKLKWELEIVKDDFAAAIATCRLFNRIYPQSPIVDQALLGIASAKLENKDTQEAINIYRQILALPHSQAKAEAQYRIAEAMEKIAAQRVSRSAGAGNDEAIAQYKLVAERYPDSEFAGPSLGKLVDYYIETRDYTRADDLLEQVFTDHPDALFLDSMLLKWVLVAYRMNDFKKAHEKCQTLIFDYPTSSFAEKAKQILPRIEEKLK